MTCMCPRRVADCFCSLNVELKLREELASPSSLPGPGPARGLQAVCAPAPPLPMTPLPLTPLMANHHLQGRQYPVPVPVIQAAVPPLPQSPPQDPFPSSVADSAHLSLDNIPTPQAAPATCSEAAVTSSNPTDSETEALTQGPSLSAPCFPLEELTHARVWDKVSPPSRTLPVADSPAANTLAGSIAPPSHPRLTAAQEADGPACVAAAVPATCSCPSPGRTVPPQLLQLSGDHSNCPCVSACIYCWRDSLSHKPGA